MRNEKLRLFIGIALPPDIVTAIYERIKPLWGQSNETVKWVPPENYHLTLKFLGSTDEALISTIGAVLDDAASQALPIDIPIFGTGAFPNWNKPSVLWAGTHRSAGEPLRNCFGRLDRKLAKALKIERETRTFHAHCTIGRVRRNKRVPEEVIESLRAQEHREWGRFTASQLTLYKSEISPSGARYTVLHGAGN